MDTAFELWNVETGNIIGAFTTTDDALDVVRQLVDSHGRSYALELTLGRRDRDRPATIVGEGCQLLVMLDRFAVDATQGPATVRQAGWPAHTPCMTKGTAR